MEMNNVTYYFSIDTGGTFTDCIARDSDGNEYRRKVLSNSTLRGNIIKKIDSRTYKIRETWNLQKDIIKGYEFRLLQHSHEPIFIEQFDLNKELIVLSKPLDGEVINRSFEITANEEAPILAVRLITQTPLSEPLPTIHMKLGSTKGTNALLENKGAKIAFFVTKGFKDLLKIGTQQRPDIFAMNVEKPAPLHYKVIEIEERLDANGQVLQSLSLPDTQVLEELKAEGIYTAAVALMNSYQNPAHEQEVKRFLMQKGFTDVSVSTELSSLIKFLPRAETTVVNAYLSPVINNYLGNITDTLQVTPSDTASNAPTQEGSYLKVMTSAGSLVQAHNFQPKDSLLSGPAGGVVGASAIGKQSGHNRLITFDMGGTSTDVARYDNEFDYRFDLKIGDAYIFSPALAIESVAAGGGSLCYFDGFKLCVGPESAGAFPGPACYGAGGKLTITDVHLLLGRLDARQFGIPVFQEEAEKQLNLLIEEIEGQTKESRNDEDILTGFLRIANEIMAGAIKKISVAKGYNPSEYSLVAFGGAGGLHVCGIADLLNIKTILVPQDAGLLSAYGIGAALLERFAENQLLKPVKSYFGDGEEVLQKLFDELAHEAIAQVKHEGIPEENIIVRQRLAYLRFKGQDASLDIPLPNEQIDLEDVVEQFRQKYEGIYGHWVQNREIEIESIRVIASVKAEASKDAVTESTPYTPTPSHFIKSYVEEKWRKSPVYIREDLKPGAVIDGFALVLDRHSTTVIEEDWQFTIDAYGTGFITKKKKEKRPGGYFRMSEYMSEEIELELFTNRFMSIAENMGAMLQRTSLSVNVKERLDFSCALLDAKGELVANAPHIPVHLGSLGVCVRSVLDSGIILQDGDTIITNHPKYGGSHLPDVTLITPVYSEYRRLIGYVVNRAHHSEIGGIRPASMPPDAKNLSEEGVIIEPTYLVKGGKVNWNNIRDILENAPYPTRSIEENMADLNAALAANRSGEKALKKLVKSHGFDKVQLYMNMLKLNAFNNMGETLNKIPNGTYTAEEFLDDGTPLKVSVQVKNSSCTIDFTGSGGVHSGNLNANPAIVNSVVIYVLRLLLDKNMPLNDGILTPIRINIPEGTILNPYFPDDTTQCPAVVGGNVETSQRLTDTLLKAFGVMACSQGTMNNVLFGNDNFGYYETICGGCGAGETFHGTSAVHHHMTNTRITDPEIFEHRYPVRLDRFEIRSGSGGKGKFNGGDGIIREITFLEPVSLSVLTQHRKEMPYGLNGGESGQTGEQYILRGGKIGEPDKACEKIPLKGIDGMTVDAGDKLVIKTPGGGGFGEPEA